MRFPIKLVLALLSTCAALTAAERPETHFAPHGALNWGYSGDRTEHLIWRLQNGDIQRVNPKAAVMLIGTNNAGHNQRPAAYNIWAEALAPKLRELGVE